MENHEKIAALYVATLRAISIIYQNNHWTVKGSNFYGDHLLFERLYKSTLDDLDLAAEKFVGLFGEECLNYEFQNKLLSEVLNKYNDFDGGPAEKSLDLEKKFIKYSQSAYNSFEDDDKLSLGLDDMLLSVVSNREEAVYLLQQTLKDEHE